MISILYQYQKEGNLPIFDLVKFVELIESHDIKIYKSVDIELNEKISGIFCKV